MRGMVKVAIGSLGLLALAAVASGQHLAGTYSDQQLAATKSLTLPRIFLYDGRGDLIKQEDWPSALKGLKQHAGDAFCCISETPPPPGSSGPPADCEKVVYGTDVQASFAGLLDASGKPISFASLPQHKYLLVEYYATWCQPCVAGRKALESFFSSGQAKGYLWVSIDMSKLAELRGATKAKP